MADNARAAVADATLPLNGDCISRTLPVTACMVRPCTGQASWYAASSAQHKGLLEQGAPSSLAPVGKLLCHCAQPPTQQRLKCASLALKLLKCRGVAPLPGGACGR